MLKATDEGVAKERSSLPARPLRKEDARASALVAALLALLDVGRLAALVLAANGPAANWQEDYTLFTRVSVRKGVLRGGARSSFKKSFLEGSYGR